MKWIDSKKENIASAGWSTLGNVLALKDGKDLDLAAIKKLLDRIIKDIHKAANRVRYTMNGFVIATGCYVKPLQKEAVSAAQKIGEVYVDMDGTACQVPSAVEYIRKVEARGAIGRKKKTVKC
jgi:hypothetical protein